MSDKKTRGWIAVLASGALLLVMAMGCGDSGGGSGGGGGLNYEGNREAADISEENAQALAASAYESRALGGPFGSIASLTDAGEPVLASPHGRPSMLAVARVLETVILEARRVELGDATSARALDEESYTINGDCGGRASFNIQIDENTGVFSGDFTFSDYCDDGTALQGQASFRGRVDPATEDLDYFIFSFDGLVGTIDGEDFSLKGDLTIRRNETRDRTTIIMDLICEDGTTGEALWINDFTITVTEGVADGQRYEAIEFSGRIYHSVHGYVDIRTDVAFRIENSDENPREGVLVLTGADGATVSMTVLSNTQYQVEADTDGDGTYDWGPESYGWDE